MICDEVLLDPRSKGLPDGWLEPLRAFEEFLRAGGAQETTLKTRLDHGRRLARGLQVPPDKVTPDMLMAWLAGQAWSLETRRSWNATLRELWKFWLDTGRVAVDATAVLPKVKAPKHKPRPMPEPVYARALMRAVKRTWLILRLATEFGLRRGEIALVNEADLIEDLAGWSLTVHGKGGKMRVIPLTDEMAGLIAAACKEGGGWAFPGKINGHLSAEYVGKLAVKALQEATLHQGRHRFATRTLRKTGNLMIVKELLGHESLATTQMYLEIEPDELRAAVEAVAAA